MTAPARERLSERRFHGGLEFVHEGCRFHGGVGYFPDGRLAEVWLRAAKVDSDVDATACDAAILASMLMQHGVTIQAISRALSSSGRGGGPLGRLLSLIKRETWQ